MQPIEQAPSYRACVVQRQRADRCSGANRRGESPPLPAAAAQPECPACSGPPSAPPAADAWPNNEAGATATAAGAAAAAGASASQAGAKPASPEIAHLAPAIRPDVAGGALVPFAMLLQPT